MIEQGRVGSRVAGVLYPTFPPPTLLVASRLAPFSIRSSKHFKRPLAAANMSAVCPV